MRMWNKTCGLSNLPIAEGTSVTVFVLTRVAPSSDRHYTTSFWKPTLTPFYATYDGCGGGINCNGVWLDTICKQLDLSVGGLAGSQLFQMIQDRKLRHKETNAEVDVVMFRTNVGISMVYGWCGHFLQSPDACVTYGFNDIIDGIEEASAAAQQAIVNLSNVLGKADLTNRDKQLWYTGIGEQVQSLAISLNARLVFESLSKLMYAPDFCHDAVNGIEYWQAIELLAGATTRETTEFIKLVTLLTGIVFDTILVETRRTWAPTSHEGSQATVTDTHRLLAAVTSATIDSIDI